MDTIRAENPSMTTDGMCEECGEKISLHSYDDEGDVLDCTGEQYVEAHLARARAAARRTAVVFVEEFGEAYDPAQTDWESVAFDMDWEGNLAGDPPIRRGEAAEDDEIKNQCLEAYTEELEAETTKLAALLA